MSIIPDERQAQARNQADFAMWALGFEATRIERWLPELREGGTKTFYLEKLEKIIERLVILYNKETNGDDA